MVLSSELVRARRRGEALLVSELKANELAEVTELAQLMLAETHDCVDQNQEELEDALGRVPRPVKYEKVWAGLKKIILDECVFSSAFSIDPVKLRALLFETAAQHRIGLAADAPFSREEVVQTVATQLSAPASELETALYSDLKGAQRLITAPGLNASDLVERYELEHVQGVLLRAVKLTAEVECDDPDSYRQLFFKLKFRQLLYRLSQTDGARYRIEIEGPFSLFEAVTKYGLQFSLVLPVLLECSRGKLTADLRLGKERRELKFEKTWDRSKRTGADQALAESHPAWPLRPEVESLLASLQKKMDQWTVETCAELLHIPTEGVCIPDLKFSAPGRPPVYLEVMGFWSREAVWRRVEWSQSGAHERVIFAVSSRLRVSEAVLPPQSGGRLYVYKGAMSASAVIKMVEELASETHDS